MAAIRVGYGPVPGMQIDPALIKRRQPIDPALLASGVAPSNLQSLQNSNQQPVFANDIERTIAINEGTYDPSYPTSLQKRLADSISTDRTRTSDALMTTGAQEHPLMGAKTPDDILAAQLAGDRDGTIKKIILSHNGLDPQTTGTVPNLKPYMGNLDPNAHGVDTAAPLDYNIIHHPEFAKTYAKNRVEGERIYKALTGRDLTEDTAATRKLIEHYQNFRRDTYEKNIAAGSKPDPSNPNSWLIRQAPSLEENTTGVASMSTAPKRSEYRPATESENDIMNSVHKEYSSGRPSTAPVFTPSIHRTASAVLQRAATDPKLKQLLIDRKTTKGGDLNPMEILKTGVEYEDQKSGQDLADNTSSLLGIDLGPLATKGAMRLGDIARNALGIKSGTGIGTDVPEESNAYGKLWNNIISDPKKTLIDPMLPYH